MQSVRHSWHIYYIHPICIPYLTDQKYISAQCFFDKYMSAQCSWVYQQKLTQNTSTINQRPKDTNVTKSSFLNHKIHFSIWGSIIIFNQSFWENEEKQHLKKQNIPISVVGSTHHLLQLLGNRLTLAILSNLKA